MKRFENVEKLHSVQSNTNTNPKIDTVQKQNDTLDKEGGNINNEENKIGDQKNVCDTSSKAPKHEVTDIELDDSGTNVENIDNASSSSQGEVTRENSIEKEDIEPSSPEEANEDSKDSHTKNSGKNNAKDELKSLSRSSMEPPDSSKMTVKDRMAIGKFWCTTKR